MAHGNEDELVVVDTDGTRYSLMEGPDKDSKYVISAQKKLTETLQINQLAADLASVGKFLLMAHCGVMGHLQLEIKVRERLHSIVKLCDDTVHTLNEFDRASSDAISNMASAYEYLVEGYEDIAFETLKEVGETSKNMAAESSSLEQKFGDEATKVEKVHNDTSTERLQVMEANVNTKLDIEQFTEEQSSAQVRLSEATEQEKQAYVGLENTMKNEINTAEERRKIAKQLKNELEEVQKVLDATDSEARMACNQASTGIWSAIGSSITHFFGGKTDDDVRAEKVQIAYKNVEHQHKDALLSYEKLKYAEDRKAELLKQQRELYAKELEERRKRRDEAFKRMAEAARRLRESKFKNNIQEEAIECLRYAITALKNLQDIMQVAATFWRESYSVCNRITGHAMMKRVNQLKDMDVERRKGVWKTRRLKIQAVEYYAQWVAIQQMCSMSRVPLTNSQRQVHMYIRQNPTKEQAKELLEMLAGELEKLAINPKPEENKDT